MFYVWQKVVRVGNGIGSKHRIYAGRTRFSFPEIGEVGTIATINEWPTVTLITLIEHDNSHLTEFGYEPGFNLTAFRPVVERKTSIEIFKRMLVPNERVTEHV